MNRHRTHTVSVHKLRRAARARERVLQPYLALGILNPDLLTSLGLPEWARGVRVEKAGLFQWAVVVTEDRGH